jgi:hypothetical protein
MRQEPHRLVFLDETGTSAKMTRLRGRCPKGQRWREPTISRLENLPDLRALLRMARAMVGLYCAGFRQVPPCGRCWAGRPRRA